MTIPAAEKQRQYRQRKKKTDYLSNDYSVTKVLEGARALGQEAEYAELIDEFYEIGGEKLVERTCLLIYSFISTVLAVQGVSSVPAWADQPGDND